ncbi:MAG: aminomethyl-transferring glycine dehydrogenase subunit GcvPA [Azospira oryzae]|nr:MAG: aminomethyl-transferring glycine dehydrogenase subunit GcvPA [Azospira oryzae]PZP80555.1 MAG: aminomethyl-transferring glycine dehydrogenase subunit GcvPA [Azospira oryzae]
MPFIPHTERDVVEMLKVIGVDSVDALFDEIPSHLKLGALADLPPALGEAQMTRLMLERAESDGRYLNFCGAGAYEHFIPAAVWQLVTRGEIYSAYTPYQAEASQGTLQLLYEYQSMMCALTAMEVSNASLYDGASALGEAVLMAVRLHRGGYRVLMPRSVHPAYRTVARTLTRPQGIELVEVPFEQRSGRTDLQALEAIDTADCAALVVPQPNYFGVLEDADALCRFAKSRGLFVIALVNPIALALLKPPGEWDGGGADIAVGDGQPLGLPLSGGGPYFGFMTCRQALVRQLPGRLVGATVDRDGRRGFALTLQAREQHIRRSKATSNICTNQGLAVAAATVYMALLGPEGLRRVAARCHANARQLERLLAAVPGVERLFDGPVFHEMAFRVAAPTTDVLRALEAQGILGGVELAPDYPELGHGLLICTTETKEEDDLKRLAEHLERILGKRIKLPPCAMKT